MTIRIYSEKNIPGRWRRRISGTIALLVFVALSLALAAVPAQPPAKTRPKTPPKPSAKAKTKAPVRPVPRPVSKSGDLASLVRDWRESPSPARRSPVEAFAAAHAKEPSGSLARLALGVGEVEQRNYDAAIADLKKVPAQLAQIADYSAYYLALARVESNDFNGIGKALLPTHNLEVRSPLAGKAWIVEARALKSTDAAAGVRLLREHYAELPQPDGDLTLADCYQASDDLPHAAEFYQRVYYQYVAGDPADRAAAALAALKEKMGGTYPQPLPEQQLKRADRLLEVRDYGRAKAEYQTLADQLTGTPRDFARVGVGAADFLDGKTSACQYFRGLDLPESEPDAQRHYYLEECGRRSSDESQVMQEVALLAKQYPKSTWRLKAMLNACNRLLVTNRPDDYLPIYKAAYEGFPNDPAAGQAHWKYTFQAYLHGQKDSLDLLQEHLRKYPTHPTANAAMYFLGRQFEQSGDLASARATYQRLCQIFQSTYYAMVARERLLKPELVSPGGSGEPARFLGDIRFADTKPVPSQPSTVTSLHIDRSRLLRTAGLFDLADSELRFGARTDGQPGLLAIEMAESADYPHQAMRIMKTMSSDYLNLSIEQAPRKFWELLFPLPYRTDLVEQARSRELDPYLLAGLIRQESEFNPQALSRAKAYGLTQVQPATGRQFARRVGISRFSANLLYQPATNLKIGSLILRSMLDQNSGKIEQTLAGYNAGPARASEWLTWNNYREPAEFVESIPFTETREYVQAVLRNADIYRRLYRQ